MEENRDNVYLQHILEGLRVAIKSIEEYLKDFDYQTFSKDKRRLMPQ